ncbi:MAG: zf-TFIIB domain-containing protein [Acidobacteriota bacterium]|nr:zf-TFIIB domain-containing protein [Acidobacteriota bacterium]
MESPEKPKITALKETLINCPNCGAAATANTPACAYCDSPLYSRACNACFSPVGISMKHCPQCGAPVMEARRAPKKDLKCPICESALENRDDDNHPIYACPQCGGLWLDHDSFQLICDRVEKQALAVGYKFPESNVSKTEKPRRAYIPCPECGVIMTPKNFARCSGIIIDCCRKHGNWFDWQELHKIVEFIQKGGMSKSVRLELSRALEDAKKERNSAQFDSVMKGYPFRSNNLK